MHNDHRSHNQRRSYDRASQGDRNAQGGARQNRGPRPGGKSGDFRKGGKPGGFCKDSKPGGYRKDDRGPRDGKPSDFRKGGKPGGFRKDGKPGSFRKDDRGPRDGKPGGYRKDGKPGGFRKDDRGPRDEQRSGADRKDFRARDGKPTGGSAPRKDFSPRTDRGPRRDSREAGHPREVFIDGKLMAASDQDVPQDRGPRFDGPRDGGRGGAPRRDQVRRQKAHKATTARELALAAIHQLRERDAFAQDIIAKTIDISPLSREDRAFATRLVLGVVSTRGTLEDIITGCMDSPDDAAPAVRDALCLSAYEIVFLQKSPHAAVDQGVELVKSVAPRAGGLANAVLRRVARAKEAFPFGDPRTDIAAYARLHGFPVWLAKRLIAELGPEGARDFMVASNEPAPVYIAVNALKAATDEEVVSVLAAAHAEPEAMELGGCAVPGCYKVASGVPLLDGRVRRMINQGLLLVSDATSQAVADLVVGDTAPESFLEIGAGRATKTILDQSIAYRRYGKQIPEYVTVDVHAFKTKLLQERAEQYGAHVERGHHRRRHRLGRPGGRAHFRSRVHRLPVHGAGHAPASCGHPLAPAPRNHCRIGRAGRTSLGIGGIPCGSRRHSGLRHLHRHPRGERRCRGGLPGHRGRCRLRGGALPKPRPRHRAAVLLHRPGARRPRRPLPRPPAPQSLGSRAPRS